jgi:hypothetical protein
MSLDVCPVQLDVHGKIFRIEGAPGGPAGRESWRTEVWASPGVIALAEGVRRPRPSRLILPSLAAHDVLVEGEELDQLEREVDALLAHALEVVRKFRATGSTLCGASEPEAVEIFRARLLNIRDAVQVARTVPRGGVWIS